MRLLLLFTLLLVTARAEAAELDVARSAAHATRAADSDYAAARTTLAAHGEAALARYLASASFSAASWRADAAVAAALAHLRYPEHAKRLLALEGLDPAHYAQRRRPEPEVGRELRRLGAPAALLIERYLRAGTHPQLAALRQGVLVALAEAKEPLVPPFLREVALGDDPALAATAATALGAVAGTESVAVLAPLARDPARQEVVRAGALRGLARSGAAGAAPVLVELGSGAASPGVRRAAIHALATLAATNAATTPEVAAALLRLLRRAEAPLRDAVVEALSIVSDPALRAELEDLSQASEPEVAAAARTVLQRQKRRAARLGLE